MLLQIQVMWWHTAEGIALLRNITHSCGLRLSTQQNLENFILSISTH